MKPKVLTVLYFLTGFLFIFLQNSNVFLPGLLVKALIISVLMLLFVVTINPAKNRTHMLMLAGLLFSWAGDVVLELCHIKADLFIPGLLCFLLAHFMYFTVFYLTPGKNIILRSRTYLLIPVLLYGVGLVYYLYDDLADMRLPVIIYATVILTMLAGAINRFQKVNGTSYFLVLAGALLFVFSDSAIAVNKFSHPFESSGTVIMSTYITAQFLIVFGYMKQFYVNLKYQN